MVDELYFYCRYTCRSRRTFCYVVAFFALSSPGVRLVIRSIAEVSGVGSIHWLVILFRRVARDPHV